MVSAFARRSWLITLFAAILLVACSKPKAPTVTPQRVDTIATSPTGLIVRVLCKANNPNSFALPTRKASGSITLGGAQLGTFDAASLPTLPARAETDVSFDLVVPWSALGPALSAAAAAESLPYVVQGQAEFEAAGVRVSAPFTIKSQVRRSDLAIPFLRFFTTPQIPKPAVP